MATLELKPETPFPHETVVQLAVAAVALNRREGDPTAAAAR